MKTHIFKNSTRKEKNAQKPKKYSSRILTVTIFSVLILLRIEGWGQISESFESGLPSSYNTSLVDYTLTSGTWKATKVIAGTTGVQTGTKSAQLKSATGSQIITPTLTGGVGIISFYVTASTSSGAYQVNVSTDNGVNWTPATGSPFAISTSKTQKSITINNSAVNKIQIYRTGATIYIDDFTTTTFASATPTITPSVSSLTGFTYASGSGPSANQTFTLNGSNLTGSGNITVAPSTNYEVSTNGTTWGGSTITYPYASGIITGQPKTVYVRLKAGLTSASSPYNNELIAISGGSATTINVTCSGTVTAAASPTLTTSGSPLTGFTYVQGSGPSANQTFTISGSALTGSGNITVTPSTNYEVSTNGTTWGGSTITYPYASGIITSQPKTVYVRLKAGLTSASSPYNNELIAISGGSATTINATCSGTVTAPIAAPTTQASAITFSSIATTSMTVGWINGNGAKRIVIINTSNSFTNPTDGTDPIANTSYSGSGQQVIYNNNSNTVSVTGLSASTTYWFRVYEYNGIGTSTKYNITTATNNPKSQATIAGPCVSEGFSGGTTAPTNWTFTTIGGTYTTSTNYGASSPSLKFDATNDRIVTPLQSNTATQLKFWIKGQGATGSYLLVEGWDGTAWSTIENILLTSITTGTTKTYNTSSSPALSQIFTIFRFTYTRSAGNLSFDDVEVTCSSSPTINLVGSDPNSTNFNVGSENNQLYRIAATVGGGVNQSITQISYRIDAAATNLNQLVTNYKLFYSTNNTLDVSDEQILYSSETSPASASFQTITYNGFSKTIVSGSTGYFFITTDVISTATIGELLQVSNVTVTHSNTSTPIVSEIYAAANTHEIIDSPSDIIAVLGSESDYVSSIINTAANLTVSTGVQVFKFKVRDGGLNGDEDSKPTILTGITLTQNTSNAVNDWSDAILTCALFNESGTRLANGVVTGTQISFTGFTQNILDNDQHIFSVRLSLQPNPNNNGTNLDGDDFVFNITNTNATTATSATSSQFGNFSVVSSENGKNVLQVVGTVLEWSQQPSNVGINSIMSPYVKVIAKDANGNIDLGPLTISITSTGTLSSTPLTASITNGYATFNNIKHTAAATLRTLTASASGCSNITSSSFNILNVTTFKPGELVFVGFDGQTEGSGAHDRYLIATMVDILPGTSFSLVNSRYEAGAASGVRTDKWGGSGDDPWEAPGVAIITYNGTANITAGSVLNFKTNGAATVFSEIFVITGTTTSANRVGDFTATLPFGALTAPNISTSGSDQIYLVQGTFVSDGTATSSDLEANYILTGNVLHGLTNRVAWVPLSDACSNSATGGNTRESRLPDALKCFNVESAAASSVSGFYENSATHSGSLRNIIIGISDVATNWTLSTSARLSIDPTSDLAAKSGKTFTITTTNPAGNWVGDGAGDLTDWFNCHNWEGLTVPTSETDVTIPSTSNLPVIDGATTNTDAQQYQYKAECRNLTIQTSGTLTIGNETDTLYVAGNVTNDGVISLNGTTGGQLFVAGNWTNNHTFNAGSLSNVTFNGNNQTITTTGAAETFNHLFFTNGTKSLSKPINANNLTISDGGILNPNANGITLSGNWTNYNETGFTESTSNVTFNGASTQNINTTGGEKFYQLTLNKSSEELVALFDVTVENNLNLSDDIFRISDITLTLNGAMNRTTGTLQSSSNTSIIIGGTGEIGGLYFTDGAVELFDLTLNRISAGSATLTDNLTVNNLITLTNGNLILNDQTFTIQGNSITTNGAFTGSNSSNLIINGAGTLDGVVKFATTQTLNNFTLNRNSGIVTMGSNLSVNGNLTLTEAELITTSSYTIDLGTLGTIIETPINPISYVTGNIKATRNIGSGSSQTFGGMGLEINEPGSSNTTVVTRVTGTSLTGNSSCCASNHSIKRYFQITPSTNSGLNATMKMHYFTHELGGVQESDLAFYKASPSFTGDNWVEKVEDVTRDNSNNWANISNVSGFSEWTLASKTNPLPVELLSFTAQCNNNSANINWTTASELNNSHFNIERSADGKSWQQIAKVTGAGNSSMPINYSSVDNQTNSGSLYRLIQVDFDGKSTTYGPISVNCNSTIETQISVYPNPFNDHLTIQLSGEETQYSIALFDPTGKLVLETKTINVKNLELNTATLAPGVYSLKVRSNGGCEVIKVVKR